MMDDLHTADLEAKVQTYEHIDKIREMLRLFATELVTRGETHDRSKLKPAESKVFAEYTPKLKTSTYGSDEYKSFLREMKPALDHHYANNRHHPEHHEGGIDGMNLLDVLEMWIDWYCAAMRHANGSMEKSIEINEKRFAMSPQLVTVFRNTLRDLSAGTLSKNRPQRAPCTMRCELIFHMTGGHHRTDCPAYAAPQEQLILGETSRPQRYASCLKCGSQKTPAESMRCTSCGSSDLIEEALELPKEKQTWDVVDTTTTRVVGTVWAFTFRGARYMLDEYFRTGDPEKDANLSVRPSRKPRAEPLDPDAPLLN